MRDRGDREIRIEFVGQGEPSRKIILDFGASQIGSRLKEGGPTKKERLEILNHSNDGFFIAGEDLRLRGPGDLFGIRQSGILDFKIADVFQDAKVLKSAAEEAGKILEDDPELERPVHAGLKKHIDSRIQEIMLEATL